MATNITIKGTIAQNQINIILSMLQSWNVKAEVKTIEHAAAPSSDLSFSTGLWADYDIDDKTLRAKAWGTNKRITQ